MWHASAGVRFCADGACDLVVEPRRHAEIVGAVITPIDADPFLLGGAVPPGYRAVLAHFFDVRKIVGIGEVVGRPRRRVGRSSGWCAVPVKRFTLPQTGPSCGWPGA